MIYKVLSVVLLILAVVAGVGYGIERWQHSNTRRNLNSQLAELQEMQQETETAYSRLAHEVEDLRATNDELQNIIDDRDEEVLALTQANIELKDKVVKIENASETVLDSDNNPIDVSDIPIACKEARVKIEFEKEEDPLRVSGYTLSNPPYAEVKIDWLRALNLELILTKNPDDTFRVYIDSTNSDIIPTELTLQVDPTVLDQKWYQKIGFGSDLTFGETGVQLGVSAFYDVFPNFYVGPMFRVGYLGDRAETFYGVVVGWYPWQ